jgi:esterase/lipase
LQKNVQFYPTKENKRGVTLVVPGLNVRPSAMMELIGSLNSLGSDVYLVLLSGHHPDSAPVAEVTASLWDEDMKSGYREANANASRNAVPLFFLGYSLGALLGQDLVAFSGMALPYKKQLLIAPAIAVRWEIHLIKWLFFLNDSIAFPSLTPKEFRANRSLPLRVYKIMFQKEQRLMEMRYNNLNIPTLVLIDPKDELISYKKILRMVKMFNLSNYEVMALDSDLTLRAGKYHHLIIDRNTMGQNNWDSVSQRLEAFFFAS